LIYDDLLGKSLQHTFVVVLLLVIVVVVVVVWGWGCSFLFRGAGNDVGQLMEG